jgi:hypothetical protein
MLILLDYCNKNLPIYLDEETECIVYKEHSINYKSIKEAYESGYDVVCIFKKYLTMLKIKKVV